METQIAAFDPVSWHTVILGGTPISAIYRGRAYYFENRGNRDAFKANPGKYLAGSPMAACPIGTQDAPDPPRRRKYPEPQLSGLFHDRSLAAGMDRFAVLSDDESVSPHRRKGRI